MTCITQHVDSVSAVLILVDGRLRTAVNMDYTLSTLSALIPKVLVNNTAIMFTHVWGPSLHRSMVPRVLKSGPIFQVNNPITLSYKFSIERRGRFHEQRALETLVELFDWMGGLEPRPATEIVRHYEQYQNIEAKVINILNQRAREVHMRAEIDRLMITLKKHLAVSLPPCLHLALESYAC